MWPPLFSSWKQNSAGSIAVIFALSILPATMAVGVSVDYAHAVAAKARLQAATDAVTHQIVRKRNLGTFTATSASASNTSNGTNPEIESYFTATFVDPTIVALGNQDFNWWSWTATFDNTTQKYTVVSRAGIKTAFMQALGITELTSQASSTQDVPASNGTAEIVLVVSMDSTMNSGRVSLMKSAINYFVDRIESVNGTTGGLASISIVPMNSVVKVPTSYSGASWMTSAASWNGCIWDRGTGYQYTNSAPDTAVSNSLHYAVGSSTSPCSGTSTMTAITPLTNNMTSVRAAANAFPSVGMGGSNLPLGIVWGWDMLTPSLPMSVSSSNPNVKKYVVILQGNANTASSNRAGSTAATLDSNTTSLCTSIKNASVRIFSISYMTGTTLMSTCVPSGDYYSAGSNTMDLPIMAQRIANKIVTEQGYTPTAEVTPGGGGGAPP